LTNQTKLITGINKAVAAALLGGATGIAIDLNGKGRATVSTSSGDAYTVRSATVTH